MNFYHREIFLFQTPPTVYLGNCTGDSEMESGISHPILKTPYPYKCRQLFDFPISVQKKTPYQSIVSGTQYWVRGSHSPNIVQEKQRSRDIDFSVLIILTNLWKLLRLPEGPYYTTTNILAIGLPFFFTSSISSCEICVCGELLPATHPQPSSVCAPPPKWSFQTRRPRVLPLFKIVHSS